MKNLTLGVAVCLFTSVATLAQDTLQTTANESLKMRKGSVATELNVNPFRGEISLNNAVNQVKFRFFTGELFAIRLAFNASRIRNEVDNSQPSGNNSNKFEQTRKSTTTGVTFGVEKHFAGTRRLSPYVGAEIAITNRSSSEELVLTGSTTKIDGAWTSALNNPGFPPTAGFTERGFMRYGANLITGFDFYMARNFFLGYEFTLGFASTRSKDISVTTLYTGGTPPGGSGNPTISSKEKNFTAGPSLINGIRIGYVF